MSTGIPHQSASEDLHEEIPITEINITPLTDVFMVLLVIFMVAAPMMIQSAIRVDLPQVSREGPSPEAGILVTLTRKNQIYLDDQLVPEPQLEHLKHWVAGKLAKNPNRRVIVNGDRSVLHGQYIEVVDAVQQAGAKFIGMGVERKP